MKVGTKHFWVFGTFLLLLFGFTNPADLVDALLSIILLLYVSAFCFQFVPRIFKTNIFLALLPIICIFLLSAYHNGQSIRGYIAIEPTAETYRSDLDDFLRTYYLMEKGQNYYASFRQAVEENAFKANVSANLWSWRFPTIFYAWKLLPGVSGMSIFYAFLITSAGILYMSYRIALKILSPSRQSVALLAPYMLYPYFHFAVRDQILLHTEWWGLLPMFLGIYFLCNKQCKKALVFFTIAISIRELFIIPVVLLGIIHFLRYKKHLYLILVPVGVFIVFVTIHSQFVAQQVASSSQFLAPRLHTVSYKILLTTFAFGSGEYLMYFLRIFLVVYMLNFVSLIKKFAFPSVYLLTFFLFPLSFLFIGSSVYNDYWGILYMPFVLTSSVKIIDFFSQ